MVYKILNSKVNISSEVEYLNIIYNTIKNNEKKVFFYLNTYSFYLYSNNLIFKQAFDIADYIIPDGYSIVWANKILNKKQIEKVVFTYSYVNKMGKLFEDNNVKIFYLGASEDTIQKFIEKTKIKYPRQIIAGYNNGFFDINSTEQIVEKINKSGANVLVVGMGMPKSEIWIAKIVDKLNVNCIFSVGGFFEFLAENKKQAPKFLYNSGFEWIYRLIQEPKRLFFRYFISNSYFVLRLIKEIIKQKL